MSAADRPLTALVVAFGALSRGDLDGARTALAKVEDGDATAATRSLPTLRSDLVGAFQRAGLGSEVTRVGLVAA